MEFHILKENFLLSVRSRPWPRRFTGHATSFSASGRSSNSGRNSTASPAWARRLPAEWFSIRTWQANAQVSCKEKERSKGSLSRQHEPNFSRPYWKDSSRPVPTGFRFSLAPELRFSPMLRSREAVTGWIKSCGVTGRDIGNSIPRQMPPCAGSVC